MSGQRTPCAVLGTKPDPGKMLDKSVLRCFRKFQCFNPLNFVLAGQTKHLGSNQWEQTLKYSALPLSVQFEREQEVRFYFIGSVKLLWKVLGLV